MAGEKILIIEDEPDIAVMLEDMLSQQGYGTVLAHDGVNGLKLALQERPALILLDLRLPQMSGMELLSLLQKKSTVPVIVVSAMASEGLARRALRMGVKDYIKKPFEAPELLRAVEGALQEGRLCRERDTLTAKLMAANQKLKSRLTHVASLYQVGQALTSTVKLDDLLDLILGEVRRVLGVNLVSIFLVEESSGELVSRLKGGAQTPELGLRLHPGEGFAGWAVRHRQPIIVHDAQNDPRFDPRYDRITGITTASALCVPLITQGRVIGVIQALNKPQPGFTADDLIILQAVALFAAVALENAQLYQSLKVSRDQLAGRSTDLRRTVNKLVRLQRMALELGSITVGVDLGDIYRRLSEYAVTLLEVKGSAILLYDAGDRELVYQQPAVGIAADLPAFRARLGPSTPLWDAWQKGQSLIVNRVYGSPLIKALGLEEVLPSLGIRSTMFAVLRSGGRSIGLFQVMDKLNGSEFNTDDQRILEIFASQSAIAIENARLFSEEKRRATQMETFLEITQTVMEVATEDSRTLLQRIVDGARDLFQADSALIIPRKVVEPDVYDLSNIATVGTLHSLELIQYMLPEDPGRILRKQDLLVCEDVMHQRPDLLQLPFFCNEAIQAFAGVQLKAAKEELGILYLNFGTPRRFEEEELAKLRWVARQAALAVVKSRQFEMLQKRAQNVDQQLQRKLQEADLSDKLNKLTHLQGETDAVLDAALNGAIILTGANSGIVLLDDRDGGTLICLQRGGGITSEKLARDAMAPVLSIPPEHRARILPDLSKPATGRVPWLPLYQHLEAGTRAVAHAPISLGDENAGFVMLGSTQARQFKPQDLQLLERLARQVGVALQAQRQRDTVRDLQEQQMEAERMAAIADIAGNAVHRLNNAVGAIRPLIQQIEMKLDRGDLPEEYLREKLDSVRHSADVGLEVLEQIRRPIQWVALGPVDVNESIYAAWKEFKPPASIRAEIEHNDKLPPVAATRQLDEVFRNLIKNAVDAMSKDGGVLSIRSRQLDDRWIEVTVEDTGPGIPAGVRDKVFQMGTTTKPGGTGFGLWWSRTFLRRLGGDIMIDSCDGNGCVFRLTLPISEVNHVPQIQASHRGEIQ
jgi:GAF domain-containing protein/FixJ family two-component response regulator